MTGRALLPVALLCVVLAGCDRAREANTNAPGSPGTGNPREVVQPTAPDTGSSGGDPVPGTTGSGTSDPGGRSQTPQQGTGLAGGLGGPPADVSGTVPDGTATQSPATEGSPNRSPSR